MSDLSGIQHDQLLRMYRDMLRIRMIEEGIADRYSEQEMRCPVHLSIGQEAVAVGTCHALQHTDRIFSTHRCHAHYLAMDGDLQAMLAEIYGKASGCTGGRGGSMHLTDHDKGLIASVPIVGSSIPLAVGSALADQIDGNQNVSVAFFGDAAVEEGAFHESANFAGLHKLPVLFVCENNGYALFTPLKDRQPPRLLSELPGAYGMSFDSADGNDAVAVFKAARTAVQRAREGYGASFLLLNTYRHRESCGPGFDHHLGYRSEEEYQSWLARCPVKLGKDALVSLGLMDLAEEANMTGELKREIDEAFAYAKAAPLPDPSQASAHIYA